MSEFKSSNFRNEDGSGGPDIVGVTTFTSPYYFVPPSGTTAERPSDPAPGMLRFNEDIGRLEVWRNDHWATILGESPNLGNQLVTNSAGGTSTRGISCGGQSTPSLKTDSIDYITVETLGNSQDFGDLSQGEINSPVGGASRTRGLCQGGSLVPARQSTVEFVTIASTGSATDYGDLSVARSEAGCITNQTRSIVGGGADPSSDSNVMDYGEIAGSGTYQDFGNLVDDREAVGGGISNGVRGIFYGGSSPLQNTIEFVTISTLGNAQDFGDLRDNTDRRKNGCSNAIRGIIASGISPTSNKGIEFLTIATKGNTQFFGELTSARRSVSAVASPTRGVFMGGEVAPTPTPQNTIDYITIMTTGNAVDFGDLDHDGATNGVATGMAHFSNGHGGL